VAHGVERGLLVADLMVVDIGCFVDDLILRHHLLVLLISGLAGSLALLLLAQANTGLDEGLVDFVQLVVDQVRTFVAQRAHLLELQIQGAACIALHLHSSDRIRQLVDVDFLGFAFGARSFAQCDGFSSVFGIRHLKLDFFNCSVLN